MEQGNNAVNNAPVKAAVICLLVAWAFALLPIPGISMTGMVVMNIVAFILAIICMAKDAVKNGILVLVGTLIITPIMYLLGYAVIGGLIGSAAVGVAHEQAHLNLSPTKVTNIAAPIPNAARPNNNSESTVAAVDMAGKWQGTYESHGHEPTPFNLEIGKNDNGSFEGTASEQIASAGAIQSIQSAISGNVLGNEVSFSKSFDFKGKHYSVSYRGKYVPSLKRIEGTWTGASNMHGSFLAWR